jgi:RNA polymerase sigma factor (sigma-70 family)
VNDWTGEGETLRAGLEAHHAESWSWALACCRGNVGQAEEALHLTYHKVLDRRARFHGRSSFKTWLFGVIRLTALDQRRYSWRRLARWAPLSEAENRADPGPSPADSLSVDERCTEMRAALLGLAARQAEVLRLVFYHDLTLDEAAEAMGVSPGTARTHYERGKERLRQRLAAWSPPA